MERDKCIEMAKVIEKVMTEEKDDETYRKLSQIRSFLIGFGNYVDNYPRNKKAIDRYVN